MRQRGVGWMGAIAAMVVAGLIVYGIIYYGPEIWRGLQGDSGKTSISELVKNPSQYNGATVVVEGDLTIGMVVEGAMWMIWEGDYYIGIIIDMNTSYELGWGETGRVRVTGIFQAPNKIFARKLEKA